MPKATVFTKKVLQTNKKSRLKILFRVLERIIKNNPKLFFFCVLLAITTAVINFNIFVNFRNAIQKEDINIFDKKNFNFVFKFFGGEFFANNNLNIWGLIFRLLLLIFVAKSFFSLIHYYWNAYAYDLVEKELKKDLFRHFIRAQYANSAEVSRNLVAHFAGDLDSITRNI